MRNERLALSAADSVQGRRLRPGPGDESISTFARDWFVAGIWMVVREGRVATLQITRLRPRASQETRDLVGEWERLLAFLAPAAATTHFNLIDPCGRH